MLIKSTFLVLASVLAASHAFIVDCQYSSSSWGNLNNVYTCSATFTEDGSSDITGVSGSIDPGKLFSDVQFFYVTSNGYGVRTYKIPSNLAAFFPNLRGIMWSNTKLETITAADLQPFPNLSYLSLGYNFIRHIPGDLFKYTPLIDFLDFGGNYIDSIGPGLFNGLTNLQSAMFYSNICIGTMSQSMISYYGNGQQGYTLAEFQADIDHLCGPTDGLIGPSTGVCSADCNSQFDALDTKLSAIETRITAPWYEKLKWFFKTAFGL